MIVAFESLLPSFLLIALGYGLVRTPLLPPPSWEGIERLNYYVLFPLLLLVTMLRADLGTAPIAPMAGAMVLAVLTVGAAMLATRRLWLAAPGVDGPAFSSHFQGAVRWQTSLALAVCGSLYGVEGLALCAIGVAAMIPLLNVLSIAVVVRNSAGTRPSPATILGEVVRNPLILATLSGAALNAAGLRIYPPLVETLDLLGRGALGVGLLLVGAGLSLRTLAPRVDLAAIVLIKLVAMPALMVGLARLLGVDGVALSVTAVCGAVPTASNAYLLARRLGGDAPLMAAIITAQLLAAFVTLPLVVGAVGGPIDPPTASSPAQQGR